MSLCAKKQKEQNESGLVIASLVKIIRSPGERAAICAKVENKIMKRFPQHKSFIDELLKAKIADCVCARVWVLSANKNTLRLGGGGGRVWEFSSQHENGTNSSFDDLFYIIETIATVLTLNIFAHLNRNCVYLCDRKPFSSPVFRSRCRFPPRDAKTSTSHCSFLRFVYFSLPIWFPTCSLHFAQTVQNNVLIYASLGAEHSAIIRDPPARAERERKNVLVQT